MKDPMNLIGLFTFLSGVVAFYCFVFVCAVYEPKEYKKCEPPTMKSGVILGLVSLSICIGLLVAF